MSEYGYLILDDLDRLLARYVAFPSDEARHATVLWVAHCHGLDAFDSTPRLALLSPEKQSGKTRTLEVLALVVPGPIHAVNMSAAALYRVVSDRQPTLLLDEADTYLGNTIAKQHEDLRGLINAGHRRGAMTYRAEVSGKSVGIVEFPAFAACALAGIGDLPDTILDRSVIVALKRRAPHETVEPFRERLARPAAEMIRDRLAGWVSERLDDLRNTYPDMPAGITDRPADVWEPLIAIADHALGDWPQRARTAALNLNRQRAERDPSLGVQLLLDCRRVFAEQATDRLATEVLVQALIELDEAPWADIRGKPLDARGLARRLRGYEVKPGVHRFGDDTRRGYTTEAFHDAWQRYLPPPSTPVTDVTVPPPKGEADETVTPPEDEDRYDLLSISLDDALSTPEGAQHA